MPRYKLLLIIIFIILLLLTLLRSEYFSPYLKQLTGNKGEIADLPPWLSRSHRLSGPYAFDYIPLDPDELLSAEDPAEVDSNSPGAGGVYVYPGGSPYPPGTLADMIWQQKQQDQRYGN